MGFCLAAESFHCMYLNISENFVEFVNSNINTFRDSHKSNILLHTPLAALGAS